MLRTIPLLLLLIACGAEEPAADPQAEPAVDAAPTAPARAARASLRFVVPEGGSLAALADEQPWGTADRVVVRTAAGADPSYALVPTSEDRLYVYALQGEQPHREATLAMAVTDGVGDRVVDLPRSAFDDGDWCVQPEGALTVQRNNEALDPAACAPLFVPVEDSP